MVRLYLLSFLFIIFCVIIISHLFQIQILKNNFYLAQAQNQYEFKKVLQAERGSIFARDKFGDYYQLAILKNWPLLYAVPKEVEDPEILGEQLSSALSLEKLEIVNKLSKILDPYEIIKRRVDDEALLKLQNQKGLYFSYELGRFYPQGNLAAQLIGFVSYKDNDILEGQYGVEKSYQNELAGKAGFIDEDQNQSGVKILVGKRDIIPPEDGKDLFLTIDINVQMKTEDILKEAMEQYKAEEGTFIIMDPKNGGIFSLANSPTFNLNEYNQSNDFSVFLNSATSKIYEPGSVMKLVTLSAALDSGLVKPADTYFDYGKVKVGDKIIENFHGTSYGLSTMNKIIEKSINTGAVYLVQKLGESGFLNYIHKFGLDEKTGVDLPNEISLQPNQLKGNEVNLATASFGQGIAVTPLQMIRSISVIANQGRLVTPHVNADKIYEISEPIISGQTASQMTQIMVSTVEHSSILTQAKIKGYSLAAKTGTAQVASSKGGYSNKFIHTLIAFFPAWDPKFIILLKLNNPQGVETAAFSLNESLHKLITYLVNYYEIAQDELH